MMVDKWLDCPIHMIPKEVQRDIQNRFQHAASAQNRRLKLRSLNQLAHAARLPTSSTLNDIIRATQALSLQEMIQILLMRILHYNESLAPFMQARPTVTSWNVGGMRVLSSETSKKKVNAMKAPLNQGPLLLQETRWQEEQANKVAIELGTTCVVSAPAAGQGKETTGGVAILLPTYITGRSTIKRTVVPNFVVQATVSYRQQTVTYVSAYLKPGEEKKIMLQWLTAWKNAPPPGLLVIGLDANQAPVKYSQTWEELLTNFSLVDVAPRLYTFETKSGYKSRLDRFLISQDYINNSEAVKVRTAWSAKTDKESTGHARLTLTMLPIRGQGTEGLARYSSIPYEAFTESNRNIKILKAQRNAGIADRAQDEADRQVAIAWAWWKGCANRCLTKTNSIAKLRNCLQRAKRRNSSNVVVDAKAMRDAQKRLNINLHIESLQTSGSERIIISTAYLQHVVEGVTIHEQLTEHAYGWSATERAIFNKQCKSVMWSRFKKLTNQMGGSLARMVDEDGKITRDARQIEKLVRKSRDFWTKEPTPLTESNMAEIEHYAKEVPNIENIPMPTEEEAFRAVITAGCSSPGSDGIPFSYWRLMPTPSAQLINRLLRDIAFQPHQVRQPQQLLCWIPKAAAGDKADNWRPLGMPITLHRIMDRLVYFKAIKYFEEIIHPAQALMSQFREPQGNYEEAQQHLRQGSTGPLQLVLLSDLMKAFELVKPDWILGLMEAIQTPLWIYNYTKYTLLGRQSRAKIMGALMPKLDMKVGVDMGRAWSVLLFCLAIDPVIRKLNSPRGVGAITHTVAYMDDNNTCGTGTCWVKQVQQTWKAFKGTGLETVQHTCCFFGKGKPRSPEAAASWCRAARLAIKASPKNKSFQLRNSPIRLSKTCVRGLVLGKPNGKLSWLVKRKCSCACKSFLIPSRQLTCKELVVLDRSPWGAKIITHAAGNLGFTLCSNTDKVLPGKKGKRISHANRAALAHKKALSKAEVRFQQINSATTPLVQRIVFATMYIISLGLYVGSLYLPTKAICAKYEGILAKVVLERAWIRQDMLQPVMAFCKIATTLTFEQACENNMLGYLLRKHSTKALLNGAWEDALLSSLKTKLQTFLKEKTQEVWELLCLHGEKQKYAKILALYKSWARTRNFAEAQKYLANKGERMRWAHGQPVSLWDCLRKASLQQISPYVRVAAVRWFTYEENDDHFEWRTQGGKPKHPCRCGCGNEGVLHPFGVYEEPGRTAAANHWEELKYIWTTFIDPEQLKEVISLANDRIGNPWTLPEPEQDMHATKNPCVLCHNCENSVEHWLSFCPVFLGAASILRKEQTTQDHFMSFKHDTASDIKDSILKLHLIHQTRILLHCRAGVNWKDGKGRAVGEVRPNYTSVGHKPIDTIKQLVRATWENLPKLYRDLRCPVPLNHCDHPCLHKAGIEELHQPSINPQVAAVENRLHKCLVAAQNFPENTTIATIDVDSSLKNRLWLPSQYCPQPNVAIRPLNCSCGNMHLQIVTTCPMTKGQKLYAAPIIASTPSKIWIAQFDGSYKRKEGISGGGGGVVVYEVQGPKVKIIHAKSYPFVEAGHAGDSEAGACCGSIIALAELYQTALRTGEEPDQIYVQGDNLPIIQWWLGTSRMTNPSIAKYTEAADSAVMVLPSLRWEYIPREANKVADHLAGVGADTAIAMKKFPGVEVQLNDAVPSHLYNLTQHWHSCLENDRLSAITLIEQISEGVDLSLPTAASVKWGNLVQSYAQNNKGLRHRQVIYEAKNHQGGGRCYTVQGAQSLNKEARLYLFGRDHAEIDLLCCHYSIFSQIAQKVASNGQLQWLQFSTEQLLEKCETMHCVGNCTPREAFKKTVYLALNTTVVSHVATGFFFDHPWLRELGEEIQVMKSLVVTYIEENYDYKPDYRVTDRNRVFYAIEHVEAGIIRRAVRRTVECAQPRSIILLHDGFWIAPPSAVAAAISCLNTAIKEFDLSLQMRVNTLASQHEALVSTLYRQLIAATIGRKWRQRKLSCKALKCCMHVTSIIEEDTGDFDFRNKKMRKWNQIPMHQKQLFGVA